MDSVKPSAVIPSKSKLGRTFAKVLHFKSISGIPSVNGHKNGKPEGKGKDDGETIKTKVNWPHSYEEKSEELQDRLAMEALLAKLFASLSTIKAAYAELQHAQSPYDADGIQAADQFIVSELRNLSEIKRCYLKKQLDSSPETTKVMAEIKEQQSILKIYEIMGKKLEFQVRLKDSEITFLKEKLEEDKRQNRSIEKRLNQSGQVSVLDNLNTSSLSPSHFIAVLRHAIKSTRRFVTFMVDEMRSVGWDIDAAVNAIEPNVLYCRKDDRCFALESFICRVMFDSFHNPNFSLPNESLPAKRNQQQQLFFARFTELKSMKAMDFLCQNPRSTFAKFCRMKYLRMVHPKMESSFFGNLTQRNLVNAGQFPDTKFFTLFVEMVKRVWLLHCLAFSFEPKASIFQLRRGCRFSEVYMESANDDAMLYPTDAEASEIDLRVAYTVVPGFIIGKTVVQSQVYLSRSQTSVKEDQYQKIKVAC